VFAGIVCQGGKKYAKEIETCGEICYNPKREEVIPMNVNELKRKICSVCEYNGQLNIDTYPADKLIVDGSGTDVSIGYEEISDLCRGISLAILEIRKGNPKFHLEYGKRFQTAGVMLDSSYK
jgi:hypothetical protein